ncbi:helix-turn-helix domain-containing protein [Flavobacterium sp.]|uniref:helix-turn-helix domain-containing protein n=1 Tax=Flavobacterium sp. TaxID=239 RepID=UPI00260A7ABC|nr:helix-turn-helix domain-containing protein [Flavobacterium sp.]
MIAQNVFTLLNSQNGNLAFKVLHFEDNSHFDHLQRLNYYSIILITEGEGRLNIDYSEYDIKTDDVLFFYPYQPFMVSTSKPIKGILINFHSDFYCIHNHQKEVACNGVLFNNIYDVPMLSLDAKNLESLHSYINLMKEEMQVIELAQSELLISYLKIILINLTRVKVNQASELIVNYSNEREPFILQNLKDAIEEHYRSKHSASDYADLLNITPNSLAKITKTYLNKTLTHLISERIIIEAKRELYLTSKSVKEIAYELGFNDEYYFSRFFKTNAEVSPQLFRETVGFAKAEA